MRKGLTEIVFIIDRSGSMSGLESDTIGGFNRVLLDHKGKEGEALITTILFDNELERLHDRVNIKSVSPITHKEYYVNGSTALLDAIGDTITHIGNIQKYARLEDVPEHTIVIITTDGYENASTVYDYSDVQRMIKRQKEKYGWEFLFIGANIDAENEGRKFGVDASRTSQRMNDSIGIKLEYSSVSEAISDFRREGKISKGWNNELRKDYQRRSKK